jgi:FkbM family methyltransferase
MGYYTKYKLEIEVYEKIDIKGKYCNLCKKEYDDYFYCPKCGKKLKEININISAINDIDEYLSNFGFERVSTEITGWSWGDAFYRKKIKSYIQIGTCTANDNFQRICNNLTEKSIIFLIEPHEHLNNTIKNNYKNLQEKHDIILINKAIVPNEMSEKKYLFYNEEYPEFSSLINRESFELDSKKEISTTTINLLFNEYNIDSVEELHIDTEGLDYEILLSIDIDKYDLKKITCEVWPFNNDDKNNSYRTGPELLNELKIKYKNYQIEDIVIDNMESLLFTKSIS